MSDHEVLGRVLCEANLTEKGHQGEQIHRQTSIFRSEEVRNRPADHRVADGTTLHRAVNVILKRKETY